MDMVRKAQGDGCFIGSGSDRPVMAQRAIWRRQDIQVDFASLKHVLGDVKKRFDADRYIHIGDGDLDRQLALQAGFEFLFPDEAVTWFSSEDNSEES